MRDLQLLRKGINFSRRKQKKWLILLALFGASSYGAYKVYHSPSVTRKRKRVARLLCTLASTVEMVSDSAETVSIVSKDVNDFLRSNSDEIPNSLNQISKLSRSNEFSRSLSKLFESVTVGILRGYNNESLQTGMAENGSNEEGSTGVSNQILDKVLSDAGTGFVSAVVGSFARNLVLGFYSDNGEFEQQPNGNVCISFPGSESNTGGDWVDAICHDKSKQLIADCVQVFVSTAVAAYLDKTMDVNTYDELFTGLTNPKHETKVRDLLASVCNGVVETFVKTSHRVLTAKKKKEKMDDDDGVGSSCDSAECPPGESCSNPNEGEEGEKEEEVLVEMESEEEEGSNMRQHQKWDLEKMNKSQWVQTVSSTLSDRNNQRFVISMTGRVTFETLRSLVDFVLWKILDGLRTSTDIVHAQVVGKGLEVVRDFSARSSVIITICLALYLHVLCGTVPLLRTC